MSTIKQKLRIAYKFVFALIGLGAVANEIIVTSIRGTLNPPNFFSYFTIQSNIIAGAALLVGAYALIKGIRSHRINAFRGAGTLYIAMTGVIFSLLLSGPDSSRLTAVPIDDTILHYIMPIALVLDWLIDRPRTAIRVRTVFLWLIYPVAYLIYSLVRGALTGWYPYPFLDPTIDGYGPVFGTAAIMTVCVTAGGFVLRAWSVWSKPKR